MTETRDTRTDDHTARSGADVQADRKCLCCQGTFLSEGFGERICRRCKGKTEWRSGVRSAVSTGRQRGSRTS